MSRQTIERISSEDLLLRLKRAHAEVTLLRKQNAELVQRHAANESYINELEEKLKKSNVDRKKMNEFNNMVTQIDTLKNKVENQRRALESINQNSRRNK